MTWGAILPISVVFVCNVNRCRSPFLEQAFQWLSHGEVNCRSVGVSAEDGIPATKDIQRAAGKLGIDLSQHRSQRAHEFGPDELVVTAEVSHLMACVQDLNVPLERCVLWNELVIASSMRTEGRSGPVRGLVAMVNQRRSVSDLLARRRALDLADPSNQGARAHRTFCVERLAEASRILALTREPDD